MTTEAPTRRNETPLALELFNERGDPIPVEGELYAPAWQIAVGYALELDGVRRAILDVRQIDERRAQVTLGHVVENPGRAHLRFVVGPRPGVASNFSVFHGSRDVSELLDVKSVRMELDTTTRRTVVQVELLAAVETFAEAEFLREGASRGELESLVRTLADERTVLEIEPDNLEGLSRRHLVQLARQHRAAVMRARNLLASTAAELCATCGLPEEAHPIEGYAKSDHAFVLVARPKPELAEGGHVAAPDLEC